MRGQAPVVAMAASCNRRGAVVLPSGARLTVGSYAAIGCPRRFIKGGQVMRLAKRNYFGMARGPRGPFVMGVRGVSVAILNAVFGIGSRPCSRASLMRIGRNGMRISLPRTVVEVDSNRRIVVGGVSSSCDGRGSVVRGFTV